MRTTLTIDPDLAVRIERIRRKGRKSLKSVVNDALRQGLDVLEKPSGRATTRPYDIEPVALGARLGNVDDVAEVLSVCEREDWR